MIFTNMSSIVWIFLRLSSVDLFATHSLTMSSICAVS